jgi:acyl-CoA synthetase (NDP forming)
MLEARSVAIVGASVKAGSLGASMVAELQRGGFTGEVYPVNPGYEEVGGHRCYPSIADIPAPVDLAILGVATSRVEQAMLDAAAAGIPGVVTFSPLYEEHEPADEPNLRQRLRTIADEHGMAMCGGNGMGFINLEHRVRACGFLTADYMLHGSVALLSHSGSAFNAFAFNQRSIGFNLIVSSGQEIVSTMADYMEYVLELESTRVLALLLETVRDAPKFVAMLDRAASRDIPVLALKMGRTEGAREMVAAHSGALAGEHGAYEALFEAHGVHQISTFDELADTMELFAAGRRVRSGSGIAGVHDSGGERSMLVDLAADVGVPIAPVSDATLATVQDLLDPGWTAANPLDAWGTGTGDPDVAFRDSLRAFAADPEVAVLAFVVDLATQGPPYDAGYIGIAQDLWAETPKPFCMVTNLASAVDREEVKVLRDAGVPVLEGTVPGLLAIKHLLHDADHRGLPPLSPPPPVADEVRERWRARLTDGEPWSELDGLGLLADYGVAVVPHRAAVTGDAAVAAAVEVGYPVALKTAAPGIAHKSDVGGVKLGLPDEAAVRQAYADLAGRLGPEVAVAAMAPRGVELALGVVRDPTFGPLVLVAAGGILVELLKDRRLGRPPLDEVRARRLIDGLKMRPILDGVRGAPAVDIGSLASAIARLSVLASDMGDLLDALDVNPVIVSPSGTLAVDALVVPARG